MEKKFMFNYATKIQSITGQDIETKWLDTKEDLINYVHHRVNREFDGVYVIFEHAKDDEMLDALITRDIKKVFKMVEDKEVGSINIFECTSYDDALKYLESYFEVSSKMYGN